MTLKIGRNFIGPLSLAALALAAGILQDTVREGLAEIS
jgi:hypothetical protein